MVREINYSVVGWENFLYVGNLLNGYIVLGGNEFAGDEMFIYGLIGYMI